MFSSLSAKAAQSVLILFLLSHFIVLSETHKFDGAHRSNVYPEMAKHTSESCDVKSSGRSLLYSQ